MYYLRHLLVFYVPTPLIPKEMQSTNEANDAPISCLIIAWHADELFRETAEVT